MMLYNGMVVLMLVIVAFVFMTQVSFAVICVYTVCVFGLAYTIKVNRMNVLGFYARTTDADNFSSETINNLDQIQINNS